MAYIDDRLYYLKHTGFDIKYLKWEEGKPKFTMPLDEKREFEENLNKLNCERTLEVFKDMIQA